MTQSKSTKRKSTSSNSRSKSKQTAKSTFSVKQEVVGLVFIAIAIWLFVTVLGKGGSIGNVFQNVLFGLFGLGAYIFPILTIFAALYMMMHSKKSQWILQTICFLLLFINLCLFLQLALGDYQESTTLGAYYTAGKLEHVGGGFTGGLLEKILRPNLGVIASYAISIIFIIAMIVVITGRSFFRGVKNGSQAIADKSKEGGRKIREAMELTDEERLEREQKREERLKEKEEKKKRSENIRVGITADTVVGNGVGGSNAKTPETSPNIDFISGSDPAVSSIKHTEKTTNYGSDEMREIKPFEKTEEKPVTHSIEKELNNGFFYNTKVETLHAPNLTKEPVFTEYTQEENGQQSFLTAKPEVVVSMEPTEEKEPLYQDPEPEIAQKTDAVGSRAAAVSANDSLTKNSQKKEKAVLSKEESEKETSEFAKAAEKSEKADAAVPHYKLPPLGLLKAGKGFANNSAEGQSYIKENWNKLDVTLQSFGVDARVVDAAVGPAVTRYEIQLATGVKVSKITSLSDDIKLALAASDIRIEAPIPGKSAVGIEVPNKENETIMLRDLLETPEYQNSKCKIAFAVGKDISGQALVSDIAKMPHMLIAGATGSGKSVCINTMIMSILFKYRPDQVKLIMIDPKVVELSVYNGIGHLLSPVVSDPKKAAGALNWAVGEMERRYQLFADSNVRDLSGYNEKVRNLPEPDETHKVLPLIVIIVDELADLMMVASNEVETAICRLAQKARAAGMHLILATQRPSVDVITGLIKANMPSRVAFSVSSGVDSRTILDMNGAERLLGKGDMLFYPQGYSSPKRVQGAFVSDDEVENVVNFLKEENLAISSDEGLSQALEHANTSSGGSTSGSSGTDDGLDELFADAGRFLIETGKGSIGSLQRRFRIGFNRAARIVDQLTDAGVLGPDEGTKPREILMSPEQFEQYVEEYV